jgi:hypothetical protein
VAVQQRGIIVEKIDPNISVQVGDPAALPFGDIAGIG